ncbi:hypothetical protein KZZ10_10315 [Alcaligenaceae bacterium LF4-65]|uniref:Tetratricopeptide repeat protein n=1 Tax=Zwartia hollandica TaxID=324606 RepID=A0A953NA24_9BURK|nr:hypothetical protein [Zwartia hollandica]MBZ1351039.1 hypothetical protein [Zwartia hollandica]
MFNWLLRLFRKAQPSEDLQSSLAEKGMHSSVDPSREASVVNREATIDTEAITPEGVSWVAFDESLLERARTQWQFGDWESLASISRESLQHHPERARLAVLVAAGHGQRGNQEKLQQFIRLAQDWGCSRKLISQVLISGVQNSLGLASLAAGQTDRAKLFFEQSVRTGMPGADLKLLSGARVRQQRQLLGLHVSN